VKHRSALELIWRAGVERVSGHTAVINAIEKYKISKPDAIIAIGKAATPMIEAALSFAGYSTNSLLVTKHGHVICHHKFNQDRIEEYQNDGTLRVIEAGHPLPDQNSINAGRELTGFVQSLAPGDHLLMLVSGGASALAELLPDEMDLDDLQKITSQMLAEGLKIEDINAKRKEISRIKNGRLLAGFRGRKVTVLAISDVEGDSIEVIGSGIGMTDKLPAGTEQQTHIIASNEIARQASGKKAHMLGFEVCHDSESVYGDVSDAAERILSHISNGKNGIYIFGGEPTVILPENPGRGGRNQQLALLLSKLVEGNNDIEILVAGTDGSDGPHNAAGGFADGTMFGQHEGAQMALDQANAGSYLELCNNLFVTGPTGTNVMDLVIAIKDS
jgi:glycerate 2-kinase